MRWRVPFRLFCHGIPERCFYVWGVPMPICARCTAIYAGLALAVFAFFVLPRMSEAAARFSRTAAAPANERAATLLWPWDGWNLEAFAPAFAHLSRDPA